MRIGPLALILALALPALLAGCTTADNGGDEDLGTLVEMRAVNRFDPKVIEIEVGDKVTWRNADNAQHSVTPNDKDQWGTEGSGDARKDLLSRGESYSFTFTEPGTFEYHCIPHAWEVDGGMDGMVGTVIVREAGNTTADNETDDENDTASTF